MNMVLILLTILFHACCHSVQVADDSDFAWAKTASRCVLMLVFTFVSSSATACWVRAVKVKTSEIIMALLIFMRHA